MRFFAISRSVRSTNKTKMNTLLVGLLQPLPIPNQKFESILMDFIIGLPRMQGKDCIYVVVNRLMNLAHVFAIIISFIVAQVAELCFREVFRFNGLPKTIMSDRDNKFLSAFWQEIFKLSGMVLTPSNSYHHLTYGKMEFEQMLGGLSQKLCFRAAKGLGKMASFGRVLLQIFLPHVNQNVTLHGLVWI